MSNDAVAVEPAALEPRKKSHVLPVVIVMLVVWLALTWVVQRIGGGISHWEAPKAEDFGESVLFPHTIDAHVIRPFILAIVAFLGILIFWVAASRKLKVVPTKGQFFAEYLYDFVSNIGRDMIGAGYRRYTPLLLTVFCFVVVSNWFGETFLFMFPTFSRVGFAYAGAILTFIVYVVSGFAKHGVGYLRVAMLPSGVPPWLYPIVIPLEFLSSFITRPLTLSIRLFANMFAGHMSIMVFIGGGAALLGWVNNSFYNVTGVFAMLFGVVMLMLELFIGFLQAYIFTILSAQYIGSSVGEAH